MIKPIEISFIIVAIWAVMLDGMILFSLRRYLSNKLDNTRLEWLKMPLFDCLICMGGIYTLILYPILYGFDIDIIKTMLIVIGINTLLTNFIQHD